MPFTLSIASEKKYCINVELRQSKLVKAEEHKTETVTIERLKLTDLPDVMRNMGWTTASALMERWFNSPPFIWNEEIRQKYLNNPLIVPSEHFDDQIVKMDWFLSFQKMHWEMNSLVMDYITPASKEVLLQRLSRANVKRHGGILCPPNPESARELDAVCQIQLRSMGSILDTINDLYGALGRYNLYLAVIGTLSRPKIGNVSFHVQKLGVYIKDVYEFTEDQLLGFWTKEKCLGKAEILSYHAALGEMRNYEAVEFLTSLVFTVRNKDFREWRNKHKLGGDFIIYSDVKWFSPKEKYIQFTPDEVKKYLNIGN